MGLLPPQDQLDELRALAARDRVAFRRQAFALVGEHPELAPLVPVLLYETLGQTLPRGAAGASPLWLACHHAAGAMTEPVQRALGSDLEGFDLGEALFTAVLESPSGVNISEHTYDEVWTLLKHADRRIRLAIPELLDWIAALDPGAEQLDPEYPYVAAAGQRRSHNANQIFRTPAWRKTDLDGALRVHPDDIVRLGAEPGGWMAVETRTGRLVARVEADDTLRPGFVTLPHGYGQAYPDGDGQRVVNGPRINLITAVDDCDPIAATPHHRNVAVRLVPVRGAEAAAADRDSGRVRAIVAAGT
jgi:anaerobic selenocysteine-containing dehydrogenase